MTAGAAKRPQVSLFAKMPIKWIQEGGLKAFGNRPAPDDAIDLKHQNGSITALKLYMTLCIKATFQTGEVKTTYSQLISLSGMSRPVIARSLKRLVDAGLITKMSTSLRQGSVIYINGWLEQRSYGMIPKRWLFDGNQGMAILKLQEFRYSVVALNALRIYLLLIGFRDKDRHGLAVISYSTISRLTGVPRHRVAESITALYDMDLISYRQADFNTITGEEVDRTNHYLVRGLNTTWASIQKQPQEAKKKLFTKPSLQSIQAANAFAAHKA